MKISHLFMAITAKVPHIKNLNYPICVKCNHYAPATSAEPYLEPRFGKCKKFGEMSKVTGEINYDYASICRENDNKCGEKGFFYEEAPKE
jgi:hypothetical protein